MMAASPVHQHGQGPTMVEMAFLVKQYLINHNFMKTLEQFEKEAAKLLTSMGMKPTAVKSLDLILEEYLALKQHQVSIDALVHNVHAALQAYSAGVSTGQSGWLPTVSPQAPQTISPSQTQLPAPTTWRPHIKGKAKTSPPLPYSQARKVGQQVVQPHSVTRPVAGFLRPDAGSGPQRPDDGVELQRSDGGLGWQRPPGLQRPESILGSQVEVQRQEGVQRPGPQQGVGPPHPLLQAKQQPVSRQIRYHEPHAGTSSPGPLLGLVPVGAVNGQVPLSSVNGQVPASRSSMQLTMSSSNGQASLSNMHGHVPLGDENGQQARGSANGLQPSQPELQSPKSNPPAASQIVDLGTPPRPFASPMKRHSGTAGKAALAEPSPGKSPRKGTPRKRALGGANVAAGPNPKRSLMAAMEGGQGTSTEEGPAGGSVEVALDLPFLEDPLDEASFRALLSETLSSDMDAAARIAEHINSMAGPGHIEPGEASGSLLAPVNLFPEHAEGPVEDPFSDVAIPVDEIMASIEADPHMSSLLESLVMQPILGVGGDGTS